MTINQRGRSRSYVTIHREDPIDEVFEEEISPFKILSEVVPIRTAPTKRKNNVILVKEPR